MGPRARKWLIAGAIVGLALGVLGWQMRSRCDNEALALELVRVEQLANTTMGLQSARGHALDVLANACSGQPEWVAHDLRSDFSAFSAFSAFSLEPGEVSSRSRFETLLTCETEGWTWWWEMPTSATMPIASCGCDRLVPFTEAEVERLQLRDDFNFGLRSLSSSVTALTPRCCTGTCGLCCWPTTSGGRTS